MYQQRGKGLPTGPAPPSQGKGDSNNRSRPGLSRAERFEDEKKRIIESCFTRKDDDGAFSESYITHIRIVEDAASPSAPPPPSSPPENKKERAIIVSVRRSGRVRLHKARENNNGTFSIGKTWVLDALSAIESFTGLSPTSYEEQERKDWAGNTGMLITIGKPYFWQTVTPKEKDFFIGSLVKIYRKYTGGLEPQLSGFTPQEFAEFTPSGRTRPSGSSSARPSPVPGQQSSTRLGSSEQRPVAARNLNGEVQQDPRPSSANSTSTRGTDNQDRNVQSFASGPSESSFSQKPQESRSRFQTLKNDPVSQSPKFESSRPHTPRDDRSTRTLENESSMESLRSKQEAQTPSFPGTDRFKLNGSYSPLSHTETIDSPPPPGPRSPERGVTNASITGAVPPQFKQEPLPERRRPPLPFASPKKDSGFNTPTSFTTQSDLASPAEPDRRPPNSSSLKEAQPSAQTNDFSQPANRPSEESESRNLGPPDLKSDGLTDLKDISSALAALSSPSETISEPQSPEELHRPGLGPMIRKKKSAKDMFRKAYAAHNAFKPRPGGAADKLREEIAKTPNTPNTPDGINGVFVAPSREPKTPMLPPQSLEEPPPKPSDALGLLPDVTVTPSGGLESATKSPPPDVLSSAEFVPDEEASVTSPPLEEQPRKRPLSNSIKYAKALSIEHSLIDGRTGDIDTALTDFGFRDTLDDKWTFEELYNDIKRELARVETGSWLGSMEHNDDRVATVGRLLDRTIQECEELEGLLTLYNVELGTLSEDVAYIEAQSQGLQVQTANQRLLHSELQGLLETINIPSSQLRVLREVSLSRAEGVQSIEQALVQLYKAMLMIDPKIRNYNRPASSHSRNSNIMDSTTDKIDSETSTMHAVQEKKEDYIAESIDFIERVKQQLIVKFQDSEKQVVNGIEDKSRRLNGGSRQEFNKREQARIDLWIYSPIILFAREIDVSRWADILRVYESAVKSSYQEECRNSFAGWKRAARKPTSEERDTWFTTQEKETENLVARKLTVKRSKTLRESPRISGNEKPQNGKVQGFDAFAAALMETSQLIYFEQNFVAEMFHVSSLSNADFPDVVTSSTPESRFRVNLWDKRPFDPDRAMAKRLKSMMDDIFSFWPLEIQNFVDWVVAQDPLQGIGVLLGLESRVADLEDSNQEYIVQTLGQIHSRLVTRFDRFVEEQVRGIEETKVKIKKRKGVISFMKTFPYFASNIENMLGGPSTNRLEVRGLVNDVYAKLNKAMFESLKFIAKESPVIMAGQKAQSQSLGDSEDKEILNYHILLIENMNHYLEEVDARGNAVLEEWKEIALREMTEHMDLYLNAVIRRPLGKLLDFLESTESLMANTPGDPSAVASRASHSRSTFKKLLSSFDANQVGKGIDALKKRVVKHFQEADDPGLSQSLITKILRECGERYKSVYDRLVRVVHDVYKGDGLEIEFRREDITAMLKR